MTQRERLRVHRGYLIASPTRDRLRASRDDEREERVVATLDPSNAEPFQDVSDDGGEGQSPGEVVGRFPADKFHFATEGDEVVIYRGSGTPKHKTDIFDFNMTTSDSRSAPPQTLRELNAFNAAHYRRRAGRR
jgi:hypothetical protein